VPARNRPRPRRAMGVNPTRAQWIGGAIVVGTAAVATVAIIESRRGMQLRPGQPLRPIPVPLPLPLPLPQPPDAPQGAGIGEGVGTGCDLGASYPGFVWDGIECVPGPETPPGIYIVDDCSDFIFVQGDDGPQPDDLETRIVAAAQSVSDIQGDIGVSYIPETDPTQIVTDFFNTFWPQCQWPPSPQASERVVNLYMALSILVGRMVVEAGGNSLGTNSDDSIQDVDEAVGARLIELGLDLFRPELVPEIDLSVEPVGPPLPPPVGPDGPFPQEPPIGPGLIDLPDGGGVVPPSQQDDDVQPNCEIVAIIKNRVFVLPEASYDEVKQQDLKIWSPTSNQCDHYDVVVGLCTRPLTGFGLLDTYVGDDPPADLGELQFRIKQPGGGGIDWPSFRMTLVDKQQYKVRVAVSPNGNLQLLGPAGFEATAINVADMDPCPQRAEKYPTPDAVFYQVMNEYQEWKNWRPIPQISFRVQNDDLIMRVRYSGLPNFKRFSKNATTPIDPLHDVALAQFDRETAFQLEAKVWSAGS